MPTEIIINGKFLAAALEGMPRVGREILKAIDAIISNGEMPALTFKILAPSNAENPGFKNIGFEYVGRMRGFLWEQIDFPRYARGRYVVNFTGTGPVVSRNGLVVIHDAQFWSTPKSFSLKSYLLYSLVTPLVARRYRHVVTVSEYASTQLAKYGVTRRKDVHIIHNGADHFATVEPDDTILARYHLQKDGFLLSNSYVHAHKNVSVLFEAMRLLPKDFAPLVLFGSHTAEQYQKKGIDVPDNVVFLGRISDRELVSLLRSAKLFLFPSLTEGFGFPPLEAMSQGCATICAASGAMPEVCGSGAIYAEPTNADDWALKISELWTSDLERVDISERGVLRSNNLKWINTSQYYINIINNT